MKTIYIVVLYSVGIDKQVRGIGFLGRNGLTQFKNEATRYETQIAAREDAEKQKEGYWRVQILDFNSMALD